MEHPALFLPPPSAPILPEVGPLHTDAPILPVGTAMQSASEGPSGSARAYGGESKEEVHRALGRSIILPVIDGKYRAPVVTLQNGECCRWAGGCARSTQHNRRWFSHCEAPLQALTT